MKRLQIVSKKSGGLYMKNLKTETKLRKTTKQLIVKTGSADNFLANIKEAMRALDRGESVKPRSATLMFSEPIEMLRFLSQAKIQLINQIRQHPDSITNIAKSLGRNRSVVYRDIHEMESFG